MTRQLSVKNGGGDFVFARLLHAQNACTGRARDGRGSVFRAQRRRRILPAPALRVKTMNSACARLAPVRCVYSKPKLKRNAFVLVKGKARVNENRGTDKPEKP